MGRRVWRNPGRNRFCRNQFLFPHSCGALQTILCLDKKRRELTMPTLRREMAEALEKDSLDMRELSKIFHIKEREVLDHLRHISRSARPKRFVIEPACCLDCGFIFKKRSRLSTPSRCPLCRSLSITLPRFKIT